MSLDLICVILAQIEKYDTEYKFYKLNISTIEKRINRKLNRDSFKKSVKELESATLCWDAKNLAGARIHTWPPDA